MSRFCAAVSDPGFGLCKTVNITHMYNRGEKRQEERREKGGREREKRTKWTHQAQRLTALNTTLTDLHTEVRRLLHGISPANNTLSIKLTHINHWVTQIQSTRISHLPLNINACNIKPEPFTASKFLQCWNVRFSCTLTLVIHCKKTDSIISE